MNVNGESTAAPTHQLAKPSPVKLIINAPAAAGLNMCRPLYTKINFEAAAIHPTNAKTPKEPTSNVGVNIKNKIKAVIYDDSV